MTLAVVRLTHCYGPLRALDGVDVEATPGRITAVIGPNASGKSTLLRCIIGGLRPTEGQVLIEGAPAHRLKTKRRAQRIAYVPQRAVVSAAFTVREVVELGRYALPPDRGQVELALRRLDLADVAGRPYPALSVGQQQRTTLARAVAQLARDGHLILDEPTSAMDLRHVRDSLMLLGELAEAGATVLIAMHDLPLASIVADDCWLLESGRLVAAGTTSEVLKLERLRAVFGVRFEWIERPGRPPILHAAGEG
ncbi:MAG: ABC transporter ATP-binding protein [Planctomycetota bacterium]